MNPLRWRKMTWLLLIFSGVMFAWMAAAVSQADCEEEISGASQAGCEAGTGIGVILLFFIWLIGFLVLSVIWFMTRRQKRLCPVCGTTVKEGAIVCKKCGYDFAAAAAQGLGVGSPMPPRQKSVPAPQGAALRRSCRQCGEQDIDPGAKYCPNCGNAV